MARNSLSYCPGLIHLRQQLRKLLAATGAQQIRFYDGEEWEEFSITEAGITKASEAAVEIDGIVAFKIGDALLQVIYDGSYSDENAEEIINDTNERAEEILA